jgi:hypothetical protein
MCQAKLNTLHGLAEPTNTSWRINNDQKIIMNLLLDAHNWPFGYLFIIIFLREKGIPKLTWKIIYFLH